MSRARNPTYGAVIAIIASAGLVLGARAAEVQIGSVYRDDPRNAFDDIIVTDVKLPPVTTADGVTVARSVVDEEGRIARQYPEPQLGLAPVLGVIPRGGLSAGVERVVAERGADAEPVQLTIDARLQAALAAALPDAVGAGVLIDIDGHVLAAVDETAVPAEDPNVVASPDWEPPPGPFQLFRPAEAPILFERPVPAGSTLKPFVVAIAIDHDVVTPETTFPAARSYQPAGGRKVDNFGGSLCPAGDVVEGLARSCNSVAVDIGERMGATGVRDALAAFGLGREPPSTVPVVTASSTLGTEWPTTTDETSLAVLGQGEARVTVLGLALAYAGLASGSVPTPQFIVGEGGGPWLDADISSEARNVALEGMGAAVDHGTADGLADMDVIAKTGTATRDEDGNSDGWVSVLFPAHTPEFVLVVHLDGGTRSNGGGDAVRVARDVLPTIDRVLAGADG